MIARAVILDMTKHFGVSHMEAGQAITPDDIKVCYEEHKVYLLMREI